MWVVASTVFLILAATATVPVVARSQGAPPRALPSEEALRRYVQGRLLEERGAEAEALGEYYRALILDPKAAAAARRAAELSARMGDNAHSLELADRALAIEPADPRALWLKGAALFNLGRTRESLEILRSAVSLDSSRVEYLQTLARVAEQLERIDLVAWAYGRAIHLDEEDGESWFQLAAARARLADFAAAQKALDQALEINPARPGMFFLRGWIREGLDDEEGAIELYRHHLQIHTGDQVTRRRLVNLLARAERFLDAYREAQLVSRARPEDPQTLEVEADLAFRARRPSEARRLADRLRRRAGDDPDEIMRVVSLLARHGQTQEALAMAGGWSPAGAGPCEVSLLRARAHAVAGQIDTALGHARQAVEACPDSVSAHVVLGGIYQTHRRYREAEQVWMEASRRFRDRAGFLLDAAFCRERLGDIDGAQAAARDALEIEPENPAVLNFLGYMLADHARDLDEAAALIQRALDQDPDNGAYIDSLGWVFYRLGRLEEARFQLERAVDLTGGDPVVHEHLGDVYSDLRLLDLAEDQYRKSLTLDSTNQRVRDKLTGLR